MTEKVWLYHNNASWGPGAVARNLEAGLQQIGVEIVRQPGKADYYGCLQHPGKFVDFLPGNTLMGPNLFVLPPEDPALCEKFQNFVTPSRWVRNLYNTYPVMRGKRIWPWPVGIDTDKWAPTGGQTHDFFIYRKDQPAAAGEEIEEELVAIKGLSSAGTIWYGNYQEPDLEEMCRKCRFAVLVTNTESQGIAYMQILSSGLPCFVVDKPVWKYQGQQTVSAEATSVPYFDDRCGMKVPSRGMLGMNAADKKDLDLFVKNVNKRLYSPRDYILESHTLAISSTQYLEFLKKT